jgi:hypothetical protein
MLIELEKSDLSDADAIVIAEALRQNHKIKRLNLGDDAALDSLCG